MGGKCLVSLTGNTGRRGLVVKDRGSVLGESKPEDNNLVVIVKEEGKLPGLHSPYSVALFDQYIKGMSDNAIRACDLPWAEKTKCLIAMISIYR